MIYYVALWTIKAALISIYMHLIPINNNLHRRAMLALKIYAGITFVIVMVVNTLWCQPVSRNWSLDPSLNCWSYAILEVNIISAVCHLTTDIASTFSAFLITDSILIHAVFLMPFPLLRHLTIPKPQKIAIAFTFGVGSISIIATILRLIFVWTTASIEQVAIWSCVEIAAGVIVICFPGLRVLLQTYLQEKGWSQGSSGRSGSKRQRQSWMVGGRQSGSWIERERDRRRRSSGLMPELEVDELTVDQHGRVIRKCEAVAMEEGLRHDRDVHIEEDGSETYIIQKNDAPLQSAISPPQMGTTTKITAEPVYGRSI